MSVIKFSDLMGSPGSFWKGPTSTYTDFAKHWEQSQFVDAQSVWQIIVTVGTDLHHILFKLLEGFSYSSSVSSKDDNMQINEWCHLTIYGNWQ